MAITKPIKTAFNLNPDSESDIEAPYIVAKNVEISDVITNNVILDEEANPILDAEGNETFERVKKYITQINVNIFANEQAYLNGNSPIEVKTVRSEDAPLDDFLPLVYAIVKADPYFEGATDIL